MASKLNQYQDVYNAIGKTFSHGGIIMKILSCKPAFKNDILTVRAEAKSQYGIVQRVHGAEYIHHWLYNAREI